MVSICHERIKILYLMAGGDHVKNQVELLHGEDLHMVFRCGEKFGHDIGHRFGGEAEILCHFMYSVFLCRQYKPPP